VVLAASAGVLPGVVLWLNGNDIQQNLSPDFENPK
jgi:hypothetical protein